MSVTHYLFDMFSFTVALLELIHIYRREGQIGGRRWFLLTLIGLLISLASLVAYNEAEHKAALKRAESQIVYILQTEPRTFDEIFHKLPFDDVPLVSEALGELVGSGSVIYDNVVLAQHDDSFQHQVGIYHAKKSNSTCQ